MSQETKDYQFGCRCGQFRGRIARLSAKRSHQPVQTRLVCYCGDCQTYARWLGAADDVLDENAGTHILQTTPDRLSIDQGAEHIACIQLREKGLLRWYASCCGTPMCNTMAKPFTAFVGVLTVNIQGGDQDTVLSKVQARAFTGSARGPNRPARDVGLPRVLFNLARMILGSRFKGRHRITPFFHADGTPVARPHLLTSQELKSARASAGIA